MDFSLIIVSWNVRERLRENLTALRASHGASFEIIVVDNNSLDDTVEMIRKDFPEVRLIVNDHNAGFGRASNQGMREATGDYRVLLNPDMKVSPTTLADAKDWLDKNPQAEVSGIRLVDGEGKILPQVRRFPQLGDQLAIVLKLPHLFPHILDSYLRRDFDYEQAAPVDSIRGSFFIICRSAVQKFGLLDERYFLWFEEVDYCRAVKERGGQVWYTPAATAIDYVGGSFKQLGRATKQSYFRDSMISYFKKWRPGLPAELIQLAWAFSSIIVALGDRLNIKARTKT